LAKLLLESLALRDVFNDAVVIQHSSIIGTERSGRFPNKYHRPIASFPSRLETPGFAFPLDLLTKCASGVPSLKGFTLKISKCQFLPRVVPQHSEQRGIRHQHAPVRRAPINSQGQVFNEPSDLFLQLGGFLAIGFISQGAAQGNRQSLQAIFQEVVGGASLDILDGSFVTQDSSQYSKGD